MTIETPTMELRFERRVVTRHGTVRVERFFLQQKWEWEEYEGVHAFGPVLVKKTEWRDVPVVEAE